jgi:CRP-like cAMP-binding protein
MNKLHHKHLFNYFKRYFELSEKEEELIYDYFKLKIVNKGEHLISEGEICQFNSFIVSGALRMYKLDDNFKEYTLQFAFKDWWIGDINSFINEQPSKLNIEAMDNCVLLQIKREDQINLLSSNHKFNTLFRELAEKALIMSNTRTLLNIGENARTRYEAFLKTYEKHISFIPQKYIASYIGVTPEFLSKLRSECKEQMIDSDF